MIKTQSAGGIVINDKGEVLIVNNKGNSWTFPKGHVEENEKILDAAKREIYEESGVEDLHYVKALGKYERFKIGLNKKDDESELKEIHMFLFHTNQVHIQPIDPNNPDAKWVTKNDVVRLLTHEKDKTFFISVMNNI